MKKEVLVEGDRIEFIINGKKLIKARNSELVKGQIALITEQRLPLTVIDDFVVRPIGKKGTFSKKQNGKEIQAKAQSEITLNPSSNFIPSTPAENIYAHKEGGKGPNAGNGYIWSELYEPLNFPTLELETLNPEPSPALVYQTTSALPSSELLLYYHHDHLGNIRAVTDQNGNAVERHDFYPFGEEITTQPQNTDQYLFTGKPRDSETGLDYFGARYYSSNLSRWMSPDVITDIKRNIENPQRWNLYIYSLNNPLRYIDPDGLADIDSVVRWMSWAQGTQKYCNIAVREIAIRAFDLKNVDENAFKKLLGSANKIYENLENDMLKGTQSSWVLVDEDTAQELADEGYAVIGTQKNPNPKESGHVVWVAPKTPATTAEADFIAFIKSAENNYKTGGAVKNVFVPKKGPIMGNVGMGGGLKNFFQYANWVFNKKNGPVKYYVPRKHWEEYQKKKKQQDTQKSQSNIKAGGRAQQ